MTLEQFGSLCNILGLVIPLVFSLSIAQTYRRPYFWYWTLSYFFLASAIGSYAWASNAGDPRVLDVLSVTLYVAGVWSLFQTADRLPGARPLGNFHRYVTVAAWLAGTGLVLAKAPMTLALTGPVLALVWAHLVAGWQFVALRSPSKRRSTLWLGVCVAVTGLWLLAFPILGKTSFAWLGFTFSGFLHLLIGIEMVLFVLEDVANLLRLKNQQLEELDRLKSNFLSTITHELRTPLSSIKSAAWLLAKRPPNVDETEMVTIISNQAEALQKLVTDVLDFSKLEAGTMSYHATDVALEPLLMAVSQNMAPSFKEKGVTLRQDLTPMAVPLHADADRLTQVLTNLLTNALKFTPKGGEVTIRSLPHGGETRIEVIDTGIGIPAELRGRVFERFFQVDNTSTRKVGGAGLGLSISKAIIEEGHGGRIWVEDAPDGGSRFVVTLPLKPPATLLV